MQGTGARASGVLEKCHCERTQRAWQSLKSEADNTIEIHTESFSKCTKLHTVIISQFKKIIIEAFAFSGCCNLRNFEIQADDIEISDSAFEGCPNLTLISNCDFVERFSREHSIKFLRI